MKSLDEVLAAHPDDPAACAAALRVIERDVAAQGEQAAQLASASEIALVRIRAQLEVFDRLAKSRTTT